MTNESANSGGPPAVDRATFQAELDKLRPPAWTPVPEWPAGRPIPQWPRLAAGHADDLTAKR